MKNSNKRLYFFDIAKGIGILSIILGHFGNGLIDRIVFTYHVPIFFVISGFFLSTKDDINILIKKRGRQLLVPYYLTCVALIIIPCIKALIAGDYVLIKNDFIDNFFASLYASGTFSNLTLFNIKSIGAIWFLWAMLWAQLFSRIVIDNKKGVLWLIVIFSISYISSQYIWLPLSIQAGGTASLFVCVGYAMRNIKYDIFKINMKTILLTIFGLIVLAIEFYFFDVSLSIVRNYYAAFPLTIIGSIFICYSILIISKLLEKIKFIREILLFFGENTLTILCFHIIELNNIPWEKIINMANIQNDYIGFILIFLFKIIFVTCGTLVVRFIKGKNITKKALS